MANPTPHPILKNTNGTAVTAQEAYDAFMNTRVLIVHNNTTYEAISMMWYDNNSAQTAPTNVGFVRLKCVFERVDGAVGLTAIDVGDSSLVPA